MLIENDGLLTAVSTSFSMLIKQIEFLKLTTNSLSLSLSRHSTTVYRDQDENITENEKTKKFHRMKSGER